MTELDNLLGSKISLISQQDVRYEGILFSINQTESSIVLQNVLCYGTENRPTPKAVAATSALIPFVSFPGNEIKDLFVHEEVKEELPPPPANSRNSHSSNDNNRQNQNRTLKSDHSQIKQKPLPKARNFNPPAVTSSVGTGEHLLKLKERTTGASSMENPVGDFDFESALTSFKKEEVLAEVAQEANTNGILSGRYIKDNFFDTLSSSVDPEIARKDRLTAGEERVLNQDTFGAIALQQQHYRRGGYRGGGRGGGGAGGGGGGHGYRGNGGNGGGGGGGGGNGNGGGYNHHRGRGNNNNRGGYHNNRRGGGGGRGRGNVNENRQSNKTGSD